MMQSSRVNMMHEKGDVERTDGKSV